MAVTVEVETVHEKTEDWPAEHRLVVVRSVEERHDRGFFVGTRENAEKEAKRLEASINFDDRA